jgi:hypothetical protein
MAVTAEGCDPRFRNGIDSDLGTTIDEQVCARQRLGGSRPTPR